MKYVWKATFLGLFYALYWKVVREKVEHMQQRAVNEPRIQPQFLSSTIPLSYQL